MDSDKIYINMGNGGGFWADREEYENIYRDTKGVETGQDDYDKEKQIEWNKRESDFKNVQQFLDDNKRLKRRHFDNRGILRTIDDNIKKIEADLKDIEYLRDKLNNENYLEKDKQELEHQRQRWTNLRREAQNGGQD